MLEVVRLRKRTSGTGHISYEVTIPKEFVEKLGWRPGDRLIVRLEDGRIVLERAEIRPSSAQ